MSQPPNLSLLRKAYSDICRGYSTALRDKRETVYIKHLTTFDQSDVDDYYAAELLRAQKMGIPSEEKKRKQLEKSKMWTKKDESDLVMHKGYVANLELTKTKAFLKSQITAQEKVLVTERATLVAMQAKKERLFGLTDEKCAAQKMQFYYIHLSFFRDSSLTNRMFSMVEMNELDEEESYDLLGLYIDFINRFDALTIRRIAVANFFSNSFYLCNDNLGQFFGKPIVDLTFYQNNLLSYGLYFKNVFGGEKVPDAIRDDPDKIEEFMNKTKSAKEALKTNLEGGATGIVGATSEDFEALGLTEDKQGRHMEKKSHL